MNKKIEKGCMAIVVAGKCPSNIGKIVTIGKFIGTEKGVLGNNRWAVDQPMDTLAGYQTMSNDEKKMSRLDDEDISQQNEITKSIEA